MNIEKQEIKSRFQKLFCSYLSSFFDIMSSKDGDWAIKGFIDIAKNIYTISFDTKVISKVIEISLFPRICQFAKENDFKMILCKEQNHYPDITFIDVNNNKYALDIKSTYRKNDSEVNGFTLGAFTGYFRNRESNKNILFPYKEYVGHFVLGIIYSRSDKISEESIIFNINELQNITSVINNFTFFINEKYQIATDRPGSGNTKNIGSINNIDLLVNGKGDFSELGEEIFDDYWMYYLTSDMAKFADLNNPPYNNLKTYFKYKSMRVK